MNVKTTLLFGVAAITLAACATPEQRCERRATDPYQALVAQISEVEMNISRGYAIETVAVRGEGYRWNGRGYVRTVKYVEETRQVPILPNLERQKLVYLQGSLEKAAAQRDAALMQCGAIAGN